MNLPDMERRKLLALMGGSVSLGLAGCLGDDDGGGGDNGGDNNTSDDNGSDDNGSDNGSGNGGGGEANLTATITSSPDSIQAGESATVAWEIENTGNAEGSQTVVFSVGGSQEGSEEVTLGSGETTTGEFSYTATEDDSGDLSVAVSTDDGSDTATIAVLVAASFAVSIPTPGPVRVEAGESATVPWQVENTGDLEGTQTLTFSVDGSQEASQEVTLGGGESMTGEFSYDTSADSESQIGAAVASDDSEATINIAFGVNALSSFTATAESARAAIDNSPEAYSDPGPELFQEIETGEPLVEVTGDIFDDGNWESTQFNVPDLIDILLGADIGEVLAGLIQDFDLQAELVEAFTLDELVTEISEIIYQFDFTEAQSQAAADLIQILLEELEVDLPAGLVAGALQGTLKNPEYNDDYEGGDPVAQIASSIDSLLGFLPGVDEVESVEDLLVALTANIDEIPNGEIDQILPYFAGVIQDLDFQSILGDFSVEAQPAQVSGAVDASTDDPELLMTIPLNTVTLVPDLGSEFSSEPPEVELDLGLELTTGESGNLAGDIETDTGNDTAQATVVDNEFTADLTEFDLAGLAEGLNFTPLLSELFSFVSEDLDLEQRVVETFDRYESLDELVENLDVLSLIEDGEPLGIVARLIQDESGRHAVEADLGLEFDDLGAVLDTA
jgi:hypothetical protein